MAHREQGRNATRRPGGDRVVRCVAFLLMLAAGVPSAAQNSVPIQTLCILDFQRLGDDARSDWLSQGLADMLIDTMNSTNHYLVVERKHLKAMLREHDLAASGPVDTGTAVRQARLAKADLLIQGSFARQGDDLIVQLRMIRVSDQKVLGQTTWTDRYDKVLAAPRALSEKLRASLGHPLDPRRLDGIEKRIPATIDVAQSYYQGVRAFDDGNYPEALAHYLDAARHAGDFRKAHPAVLEMYYLLGQSEHAVLLARDLAQSCEQRGDVPCALEYYFTGAQTSLDPLHDPKAASDVLEKLLRLVERHERKTGEIARTRKFVLARIDELQQAGKSQDLGRILADREIRYRIWTGDIEGEVDRREEERARGGYTVLEGGQWVKRPVPPPSVLMWRIRARRTLARAYARSGEIRPALDQYQELLGEYEFLTPRLLNSTGLLDPIKTEAHFMLLRHYTENGRLVRDHAMNRINNLNLAGNALAFQRDFSNAAPDKRARVSSRFEGRGYEYFDFAAPAGHRIESVTLRIHVEGIAEFGIDVPRTAGWPPQYSFSKRMQNFKFSKRGAYERKIVLPPGTEFFSIGTSWGPGLFTNTKAEVDHWKQFGPKQGPDIARWEASFVVTPMKGESVKQPPAAGAPLDPVVQKLIDRYAAGWERGSVLREGEAAVYTGNPRLDVYAEDWLVYSLDGDIRIFHQRDLRRVIHLPVAINTRDREFDPSLVRTHDGRYALLCARGTSRRSAMRFAAVSADLVRWETPQRLTFEEPSGNTGYTYAQAEPLERTWNIVPVRKGYAMLLAQGFLRHSADLRRWGPPRKAIPQDLLRNRLLKSRDGTVWAVYENSSAELQPYTPADWLSGYFVTGGKQYKHVTELRVSRSVDGIQWEPAGKAVVSGQPSALWAFALNERQIGIAAGFNNLYMKWFTAHALGDVRPIESRLQLMHQSDDAEFFVHGSSVTCVRPVMDFERQKPMLLAASTDSLLGGGRKK